MNEFCAKMEKLGTPVSTCKTKQQNPTSENLSMTFPIKGKIIREYSKGKNDGIDMSGAAGGSVVAAADGTIAAITADADHVPIMVIKHRNDLLTVYANIYNIKLTKGDTVRRGQKIAELPTQAPVSIHFEVRKGFNSINPMDFLE